MQAVLQAILLQGGRAKTGSLLVASFLAMGGKHNNTRYRPRDELPCRVPGRFRRGSILSSKALDAWRTLCEKRCANTLWTNPDVCLSGSYVYLSFLLFISQLAARWLLLPGGHIGTMCLSIPFRSTCLF